MTAPARQAKGYKSSIIVDFETDFGVVPDSGSRKGWRVPIVKSAVASKRPFKAPTTITGSRNPVEPDEDNLDVSGSLEVPLDAHNYGLHLKGFFGDPAASAVVLAVLLDAAAAVDKGSGKVGIACANHGLAVGAPVIITGTTHYDGAYILAPETTASQLVITAAYTAESIVHTATVQLGSRVVLSGAARDAGSGKVGLPCAGHGLPTGALITVAGSTHYDAAYTVLRGSTLDELLVTATFTAETFSGAAKATALFYDHTFKVTDEQPSMIQEKAFPALSLYYRARGCKHGKLPIKGGGAGEITTAIDVMGAGEDKDTSPYVASPVELPVHKFLQRHLTVLLGGVASSGRVSSLDLSVDYGLDGSAYTINTPDKAGERGDICEGALAVSGTLAALFKDGALVDLGLAGTKTSLTMLFVNGGYQLQFDLAELKYERSTPPIDGPKGVMESHGFQAYHDSASTNSVIVARLRNEIYDMGA